MVAKIQSYRDLIVWQKAMDLAVQVYSLTARFPKDERFRLVDQLTRAVVSVPANIAEGYARDSPKDYARFLAIARGSLAETETFVLLAVRLDFVRQQDAYQPFGLIDEISRMLTSLRKKVLQSRS